MALPANDTIKTINLLDVSGSIDDSYRVPVLKADGTDEGYVSVSWLRSFLNVPGAGGNVFESAIESLSVNEQVQAPGQTGPEYDYVKGLLDIFANRPRSGWYSAPKNPSLPAGSPTPSLMTVADGYHRFPATAAMCAAYEATGDESYANLAFDCAMDYINDGRFVTGDGYLDWWAGSYNDMDWDKDHYEWRAATGVGHALTLLINNTGLAVSTAANRQTLAEFLRDHCWDKWQSGAIAGAESNIINDDGTYNLSRILVWVVALDKYYGGTTYANWLSLQGQWWSDTMSEYLVNGRVEQINYLLAKSTRPKGPSDISHGTQDANALVYLYENGYTSLAPLSLVLAMKRGLDEIIWQGNGFASYTDGTGSVNSSVYGDNLGGWFALLKHDQTNISDYITWIQTNPNNIMGSGGNVLNYEAGAWVSANLMKALAA